jgi:hypothetical protein
LACLPIVQPRRSMLLRLAVPSLPLTIGELQARLLVIFFVSPRSYDDMRTRARQYTSRISPSIFAA